MKSIKTNHIYQGSSLEVLKTFPDESIDCVMTSPPYWGLRDYGTATWEGGSASCDHKKNPPAYSEKALAKSTIGKAASTGHAQEGYKNVCGKCGAKRVDKQLGLETTFQEYINKLCDIFDEVKRVLKKSGTCFVNLGDTYMNNSSYSEKGRQGFGTDKIGMIYKKSDQVKTKSLCQIPSRFAIEMTNRGWILRNEIIWYKPNCMPSSVKDRFIVDFEKLFFFTKSKKYWFERQYQPYANSSFDRYKYDVADHKVSLDKRKDGWVTTKNREERKKVAINPKGVNKRCVWKIPTKPFKEAHFAVFPEKLVETPIKAGCPVNGIVLDPFMGSGTVAVVAKRLNRKYIGIDLNPEYIKMAKKRIANVQRDLVI